MTKCKFQSVFSSVLRPIVSAEKDKFLSIASLKQLQNFIPEIDTEKNYDLLPVSFNACVVNRVNKNGDVIDTDTAIALCQTFINKPINIEHERKKVVGVILTAGFSEFGTDIPLKVEYIKDMKGPFNITLGGVLWRAVSSGLTSLVEECADPTSENYLTISASWELGFTEFNIVLIEGDNKNIESASKIITEEAEVEAAKSNLKSFGGSGQIEGKNAYRMPKGNDGIAMGIGLTEQPAAEVKGVAVSDEAIEQRRKEEAEAHIEAQPNQEKIESIVRSVVLDIMQKNANDISQAKDGTVKDSSIIMKITSVKDITDDSLKQIKASAVTDFISEQIAEADKKYLAEKADKEKSEAAQKEALSQFEMTKLELAKVQASLEEIKKANAARAKQEAFDSRMESLSDTYELNEEDRKVIASRIKDLDAEAFASYEKELSVLMKEKSKEFKKAQAEAAKAAQTATASTAAATKEEKVETVVDNAVDKSKVAAQQVPATTSAGTQTLKDKFAKAFELNKENFSIRY